MAETSIQWCDYTFNPWSGCAKISPGCKNCYAEVNYSVKMRGVKWGPQGNRIVAAESMWKQPLKWDRLAREGVCLNCHGRGSVMIDETQMVNGEPERIQEEQTCNLCSGLGKVDPYRARVFCASLADVFEDWQGPMLNADQWPLVQINKRPWTIQVNEHEPLITMQDVRDRLFRLIDQTPNLDWLLLTKRPENIERMWPSADVFEGETGDDKPVYLPNLWIGTSVENQQAADERIPHLLRTSAAVRFLSCEPLLGPVDLTNDSMKFEDWNWLTGESCNHTDGTPQENKRRPAIDWVIVGGESGHGARPCNIAWIRSIIEQCKAANVPCFVKQLGAVIHAQNILDPLDQFPGAAGRTLKQGPTEDCAEIGLIDRKGGNPAEWPENLRVREFPEAILTYRR